MIDKLHCLVQGHAWWPWSHKDSGWPPNGPEALQCSRCHVRRSKTAWEFELERQAYVKGQAVILWKQGLDDRLK